MFFRVFFATIFVLVNCVTREEVVEVDTLLGKVRGVERISSRDNTTFFAFYGIPFAKPPIGELRFKAPVSPEPWSNVLDATAEKKECTNLMAPGKGAEDCLYLNVYTPTLPVASTELKAVYVMVHGGAFLGGSSLSSVFGPDFLLDKDIVLVTFNYRVGVLGFLSLQNEDVPGNSGLKDQRMVLQWVQANIANFGGDPNKVTLGGQSAGGASTGMHLLSSSTAGLFRAAILQSGTALTPWAFKSPDMIEKSSFHLGVLLGCFEAGSEHNKTLLLECLQNRPANALVDLEELALTEEDFKELRPMAFVPTVEPDFEGAFLTDSPRAILESRISNPVPILTGSVSNEGLLILPALRLLDKNNTITQILTDDLTRFVPDQLNFTINSPLGIETSNKIREYYFNNETATHEQLIYVVTIVQFILQIQEFAKIWSEKTNQPVYNYLFTYDGPYATNKPFNNISDVLGVMHGDEMGYLTNVGRVQPSYANHTHRDSVAEKTIDRMTSLWTNFIKTGDPSNLASESTLLQWDRFRAPNYSFLDIDEQLEMKNCALCQHIDFWNDIMYSLGSGRPYPSPNSPLPY